MVDIINELKLKIIENERKQLNIDKEIDKEIEYARNNIKTFEILIEKFMLDKKELRLKRLELEDELDKELNKIVEEELLNN